MSYYFPCSSDFLSVIHCARKYMCTVMNISIIKFKILFFNTLVTEETFMNEQRIICKNGECSKEFCVFDSVPICPDRVTPDHHLRLF